MCASPGRPRSTRTATRWTRLYVTDIDDWEAIGRAHGEVFGDVRPVATVVAVVRLIDPALCVEIEAEAVVD